jgi:hypothetical protein
MSMKVILKYSCIAIITTLAIYILASCSVIRSHTTKMTEIYGSGVMQKPTLVDLEVKDTKAIGTATSSSGEPLLITKNNAVYDALKNANADVLIEPIFDTETSNGKTKVTVSGYPAYYKNFRPMVDKDTALIKAGIMQKTSTYELPTEAKKKGGGSPVLGALAGIGLALLLAMGI